MSDRNSHGCFWTILVFVGLIAVILGGGRACTAIGHSANAREATRQGEDLVAALDSYGPIAAAKGKLSKSSPDDLYSGTNDNPTDTYIYTGSAEYNVEPGDGRTAPEAAYAALQSYLINNGWERGPSDKLPEGHSYYVKGDWMVDLFYLPGENPGDPVKIRFELTSPSAGGFVLPGL